MRKKVEVELDDTATVEYNKVEVVKEPSNTVTNKTKTKEISEEEEIVNPLRNERITIHRVPKENGMIKDPKHIAYGGMIDGAVRWFTVPVLSSGNYVNVLTNAEKKYLEDIMGLEDNALSIYKKVDNFWDNFAVRVPKEDSFLNLADPDDYIKYKVLLANKEFIAPSIEALEDQPKATYQFVLISADTESAHMRKKTNINMQAYMTFGKIQDDKDKLRTILEIIEGKPYSADSKIEYIQDRIGRVIQADPKLFLKVASDALLDTKILIKKAIAKGLISNRGGMLYMKSDGSPLCGDNQEPTLNTAARFLNIPKNQDLLFSLEARIKE